MVDIGNYGDFSQGVGGQPGQVGGIGGAPAGLPPAYYSTYAGSSISQSDAVYETILAAQYPLLVAPGAGTGAGADVSTILAMAVNQKEHDIICSIWDNYLKQIREFAERSRIEDIEKWTRNLDKGGPKSSAEYYAFLLSVSALERADEMEGNGNALEVAFRNSFNSWTIPPVGSAEAAQVNALSPNSGSYELSFALASMMAGPDLVRQQLGISPNSGNAISVNPVSDAIFQVGPSSGLPIDSQAAAALMAALLYNGLVNRTTLEVAGNPNKIQTPDQVNLDFAIQFSKNVMALVTQNIDSSEAATPEQAAQNRTVRLMLSLIALNLLLRIQYGGMTGEEFRAILDPNANLNDIDQNVREQVQQLVKTINSDLPDDPVAREGTLQGMMAFVDENNDYSKKSVDSMLDSAHLLSSFLQARNDADGNAVSNRLV